MQDSEAEAMSPFDRFQAAHAELEAAEAKFDEAMRAAMPIGATVFYEQGSATHDGEVEGLAGRQVLVNSEEWGRFWIDAHRVSDVRPPLGTWAEEREG